MDSSQRAQNLGSQPDDGVMSQPLQRALSSPVRLAFEDEGVPSLTDNFAITHDTRRPLSLPSVPTIQEQRSDAAPPSPAMTLNDRWGYRPVRGNAWAQVEEEDVASASIEYHEFLRSPGKTQQPAIRVNLPTTTTAKVDRRKQQPIRPATPLVPVPGKGPSKVHGKNRNVTDSILPKPLKVSPKVSGSKGRAERAATTHSSSNAAATGSVPVVRALDGPSQSGTSMDPRPVRSTPGPEGRGSPLLNVFAPSPGDDLSENASGRVSSDRDHFSRPDAIVMGDGRLSPTKSGSYGRMGTVQVTSGDRVPSMAGVLGHVGHFDMGHPSPSSMYSDGLHMGPPVPPKATFLHALESRQLDSRGNSTASIPVMFRGHAHEITSPGPGDQVFHPTPFLDTVPPPAEFRDSLTFEQNLVALIMGVHHHLDQETGQLTHSLNNKHDAVMDQVARRHEKAVVTAAAWVKELGDRLSVLEKGMDREHGAAQAKSGLVESMVRKLHDELHTQADEHQSSLKATLEGLNSKTEQVLSGLEIFHRRLDHLEARMDVTRCHCFDTGGGGPGRNAFANGNHVNHVNHVVPPPPNVALLQEAVALHKLPRRSGRPGPGEAMSPEEHDGVSSTGGEEDIPAGVQRVEAVSLTWTTWGLVLAYMGIFLMAFCTSLESQTVASLSVYATSAFKEHSLISVVLVVQGIVNAVIKPPMAKIADVFGRLESFSLAVVLYVLGYAQMAASRNVETYAAAQIFYSAGSTGLQILQQIFIADTSDLLNRALWASLPDVPFLVTVWIGPPMAQSILQILSWRWGYGIWAIILPLTFLPLAASLFFNARKASRLGLMPPRSWKNQTAMVMVTSLWVDLDIMGLLLLSAALSLILIPLNVAALAASDWRNPGIVVMLVIGVICLGIYPLWESNPRLTPKPFLSLRLLRNRTMLAGCGLAFFYFMAFYLSVQPYFNSYLQVVRDESVAAAGQITQIFSFTATIGSIIISLFIKHTAHYKYYVVGGSALYLLAIGLLVRYRTEDSSTWQIIGTQITLGLGGGMLHVPAQLGVQASARHSDVAAATAIFLTFLEVGGAVGAAISGAIWTSQLPPKLREYLPEHAKDQAQAIFASLATARSFPAGSPERDAINQAYQETMATLLTIALGVCVPLIPLSLLMKNHKLDEMDQHVKGTVIGSLSRTASRRGGIHARLIDDEGHAHTPGSP
ncbi:MAG: hypothetical protein M1838_002819 [Thelocarpon superellum]|nr:MAG: hypothetical protein M1838_002819 [Thelocarpon superellum]